MCSIKTLNNYALTFLTNHFMVFFAENMVKLFVENDKEGPSRKVMECLQNKQNVSQIWHCGFKLAAAAMQAIF